MTLQDPRSFFKTEQEYLCAVYMGKYGLGRKHLIVVKGWCAGKTDSVVMRDYGFSSDQFDGIRRSLFDKLQVSNAKQVCHIAGQFGILPDSE